MNFFGCFYRRAQACRNDSGAECASAEHSFGRKEVAQCQETPLAPFIEAAVVTRTQEAVNVCASPFRSEALLSGVELEPESNAPFHKDLAQQFLGPVSPGSSNANTNYTNQGATTSKPLTYDYLEGHLLPAGFDWASLQQLLETAPAIPPPGGDTSGSSPAPSSLDARISKLVDDGGPDLRNLTREQLVRLCPVEELTTDLAGLTVIGHGSRSVVCQALWRGARVVVKFTACSSLSSSAIIRQALVSKALAHPSVLQHYSVRCCQMNPRAPSCASTTAQGPDYPDDRRCTSAATAPKMTIQEAGEEAAEAEARGGEAAGPFAAAAATAAAATTVSTAETAYELATKTKVNTAEAIKESDVDTAVSAPSFVASELTDIDGALRSVDARLPAGITCLSGPGTDRVEKARKNLAPEELAGTRAVTASEIPNPPGPQNWRPRGCVPPRPDNAPQELRPNGGELVTDSRQPPPPQAALTATADSPVASAGGGAAASDGALSAAAAAVGGGAAAAAAVTAAATAAATAAGAANGGSLSSNSYEGFGNPFGSLKHALSFEHVAALVAAKEGEYLTAVIMEHADKATLQRAVERGLFVPNRAWSLRVATRALLRTALEVAFALQHLHSRMVVHGSLRPTNVLLKSANIDRRGFTVKVTNFSLARLCYGVPGDSAAMMAAPPPPCAASCAETIASKTTTECAGSSGSGSGGAVSPGTDRSGALSATYLPFWSPEQLCGVVGKPSDVYAFGVVLYYMVCRQLPYSGVQPADIVKGVTSGALQPIWPEGVTAPAQLLQLCQECWQTDPRVRPTISQVCASLQAMEHVMRQQLRNQSSNPSTATDSPYSSGPQDAGGQQQQAAAEGVAAAMATACAMPRHGRVAHAGGGTVRTLA